MDERIEMGAGDDPSCTGEEVFLSVEATVPLATGREGLVGMKAVLGYLLAQRQVPASTLLMLSSATPLRADRESVARATLESAVRTSDLVAPLGAGHFAVLLSGCRLSQAHHVVRKLEERLALALAPEASGWRAGLAELERGEKAQVLLERAAAARPERPPTALRPPTSSADEKDLERPLVLYAGASVGTFLQLQQAFGERGALVLWASDRETIVAAHQRLTPALLLADVMLPPSGGHALVEALSRQGTRTQGFVVAPRRWGNLERGRSATVPTLQLPLEPAEVRGRLAKILGLASPPLPPLSSEAMAAALRDGLQALVLGLPSDVAPVLERRPELRVLRARLEAQPALRETPAASQRLPRSASTSRASMRDDVARDAFLPD